jgi:hypothetical protein
MRHLLNAYIQADPAADLGNLSALSLTELIVETPCRGSSCKEKHFTIPQSTGRSSEPWRFRKREGCSQLA